MEQCSFLVNGARSDAQAPLQDADRVDVLPPFAGG
jgi:thiS family protein